MQHKNAVMFSICHFRSRDARILTPTTLKSMQDKQKLKDGFCKKCALILSAIGDKLVGYQNLDVVCLDTCALLL